MGRVKKYGGQSDTFTTKLRNTTKEILIDYKKYKLNGNDLIEFFVETVLPYIPIELLIEYKKNNTAEKKAEDYFKEILALYTNDDFINLNNDEPVEVENSEPKTENIIKHSKKDDFSSAIDSLYEESQDYLNL